MAGQILTDADYLKQVKEIEERLETAIKNCKTYTSLDSIQQNVNDSCLIILKWIKTGKDEE